MQTDRNKTIGRQADTYRHKNIYDSRQADRRQTDRQTHITYREAGRQAQSEETVRERPTGIFNKRTAVL